MRLVITAVPLIDRWSVTTHNRRDMPAWPPSPDTMFSAFVASAASLGDACNPALYWLENLGNPAIEAEVEPGQHGRQTFEPVADYHEWSKESHRKARSHNSVGAGAVSWSWEIEAIEHLEGLHHIAENVTYIGSSRGPVMARAFVTDSPVPHGALVPVKGNGNHRIRGIYSGRLDELESAFQAGERPKPTLEVGYVEHGRERITSPWERMIPLRADRLALSIRHTVPLSESVRQAIMQHIPDRAPAILTGHDANGSAVSGNHLAIVPLPRVADSYANGELYGAGLMLPRGVSDGDYDTLLQGLGGWIGAGGRVEVGPIGLTMAIANGDTRKSLQPDRYNGFSRHWRTVTPIVFDRHPRRSLTAADVVANMCRDAGLSKPDQIEVSQHGMVTGAEHAGRHSLGGRKYLQGKLRAHVRMTFERRIPGPVLIGRGRYFGLGVMVPC